MNLLGLRGALARSSQRYAQQRLAKLHPHQRSRWHELRKDFISDLACLDGDITHLVTDVWHRFNSRLESALLPLPPYSFLRDPTVRHTMFVDARERWMKEQLALLKQTYSLPQLKSQLVEDDVGRPPIASVRLMTSHNSIHHHYHFTLFGQKTGLDLNRITRVIEWGGGYGNQAKIFTRINPEATYTIIDTPLFCALQKLYLSTVLGRDRVHLISTEAGQISERRINLLPLSRLEDLAERIQSDLFVSTWGLSESSTDAQDFVVDHRWFDADHLLLSFQHEDEGQDFPAAARVGALATERGASIEPFPFVSKNSYAFL